MAFVRVEDPDTHHQFDIDEGALESFPQLKRVAGHEPHESRYADPPKFRTDKAGSAATKKES